MSAWKSKHAANRLFECCVLRKWAETNAAKISYAAGGPNSTAFAGAAGSTPTARPVNQEESPAPTENRPATLLPACASRRRRSRIKRTWDLWPLAAETAKEPSVEDRLSKDQRRALEISIGKPAARPSTKRDSQQPRFRAIGIAAFLLACVGIEELTTEIGLHSRQIRRRQLRGRRYEYH
jgi:hypothetical protein